MKITRFLIAVLALLAGPAVVLVLGNLPAEADDYVPLPAAASDNGKSANVSAIRREPNNVARTHYRRLHGQWWYRLPNKQWARWDGSRWTVPASTATSNQKWRR